MKKNFTAQRTSSVKSRCSKIPANSIFAHLIPATPAKSHFVNFFANWNFRMPVEQASSPAGSQGVSPWALAPFFYTFFHVFTHPYTYFFRGTRPRARRLAGRAQCPHRAVGRLRLTVLTVGYGRLRSVAVGCGRFRSVPVGGAPPKSKNRKSKIRHA